MFPGRNLKQTSSVPSVVAFRANAIVRWVRGIGTVFAVTRNASKSPIASQRYLNRNATSAPANSEVALGDYERDAIFPLDTEIYEE